MTVIFSDTPYDTPEILALRNAINEEDQSHTQAVLAHHRKQRELCDRYERLLAVRRPAYPTPEHLTALDQVAFLVHSDAPYGNHLGYATEEDRAAGRELPTSVDFCSTASRINIHARAPLSLKFAARRLWEFSAGELDAFRQQLGQRSLRIISEWVHEDGIAFIVASSKLSHRHCVQPTSRPSRRDSPMARTQKITKYQVDQWKATLEQMLEQGNFRQDGRPLSPAGIAERKQEIAMLRGLNTLRVGQVVDLDTVQPIDEHPKEG
ncbi:hypothetical protein [Streptomyces turgidiscabies]|uniref:hypothetical protein n=1 Tax=Streptomyces turgidiscabies TaxID=85558 RepID=UPI0038F5E840